jgi:hypothetical protein
VIHQSAVSVFSDRVCTRKLGQGLGSVPANGSERLGWLSSPAQCQLGRPPVCSYSRAWCEISSTEGTCQRFPGRPEVSPANIERGAEGDSSLPRGRLSFKPSTCVVSDGPHCEASALQDCSQGTCGKPPSATALSAPSTLPPSRISPSGKGWAVKSLAARHGNSSRFRDTPSVNHYAGTSPPSPALVPRLS